MRSVIAPPPVGGYAAGPPGRRHRCGEGPSVAVRTPPPTACGRARPRARAPPYVPHGHAHTPPPHPSRLSAHGVARRSASYSLPTPRIARFVILSSVCPVLEAASSWSVGRGDRRGRRRPPAPGTMGWNQHHHIGEALVARRRVRGAGQWRSPLVAGGWRSSWTDTGGPAQEPGVRRGTRRTKRRDDPGAESHGGGDQRAGHAGHAPAPVGSPAVGQSEEDEPGEQQPGGPAC